MEYRIKISYQTGDSFHSEDAEDYLELTWKNIDIAKENLQRIKEHYEMYKGINSCSSYMKNLSKEEWFEKNKDKNGL
jgi:hypothetical protein